MAADWAKNNTDEWSWMVTWSEANILPPTTPGEVSMFKKASANPITAMQVRPNTERVTFLHALSNNAELKMHGYDSDQDTFEMEFKPDDVMWALDGTENKYV